MRDPIDDAWYESLFKHRGRAKIAGEATPGYALLGQDLDFRHIKRLAPDVRADVRDVEFHLRQAWSQFLDFEGKRDHRGVRGGLSGAIEFCAGRERAVSRIREDDRRSHRGLAKSAQNSCSMKTFTPTGAPRPSRFCVFLGVEFRPGYFSDLMRTLNQSRVEAIPPELRAFLVEEYRTVARDVAERMSVPQSWRDDFRFQPETSTCRLALPIQPPRRSASAA